MFSLSYSGQIIIWVMVGGLGTLIGPIVGAILLQILHRTWAGTLRDINPSLILWLHPDGRPVLVHPARHPAHDRPRRWPRVADGAERSR